MFQIMAALFFTVALIAPLVVIVLTLHLNWNIIVTALRGPISPAPLIIRESVEPRVTGRITPRPARRLPASFARVAA